MTFQLSAALTYWYQWCPASRVTSMTALDTITTADALIAITRVM